MVLPPDALAPNFQPNHSEPVCLQKGRSEQSLPPNAQLVPRWQVRLGEGAPRGAGLKKARATFRGGLDMAWGVAGCAKSVHRWRLPPPLLLDTLKRGNPGAKHAGMYVGRSNRREHWRGPGGAEGAAERSKLDRRGGGGRGGGGGGGRTSEVNAEAD